MHVSPTFCSLMIVASGFLIFGCNPSPSNSDRENQAKPTASRSEAHAAVNTNVEELGLLIKVPYETEDVVWKQNPTKRSLIAVLRFSANDAAKVSAAALEFGAAQPTIVLPESWFPDELIAQSEMAGDNGLRGQVYPANSFLMEPFSVGKLTRIDGTDYFVLEVSAK